jgi:hypothetical protein
METTLGRPYWTQLVAEADRVGSVAETAARHAVNARTLAWWRWRLRSERSSPAVLRGTRQPRLLPVVVAGGEGFRTEPIEIAVGSVGIRVAVGTDTSYVASLVEAIRAAC